MILKYKIRVVCMEEYEHITNSDEYIGSFMESSVPITILRRSISTVF